MIKHRSTLRLRVVRPALLSQDNLQKNRPQSSWPTDFEGSLFNRLLCQGSGLHPQTGSPQNQWAFSFAQESWNRLAACSSGVLAVLFGSGQSPVVGHHYFQNMNQGGLCSAGAGARASADCINRVCRRSICWSFMASWAVRASTTSVSPGASAGGTGGASAAPTSTLQMPSCLMLGRAPALIRLRTVSADTPKCIAASLIVKSMVPTVGHRLVRSALVARAGCGQFAGAPGRPVAA